MGWARNKKSHTLFLQRLVLVEFENTIDKDAVLDFAFHSGKLKIKKVEILIGKFDLNPQRKPIWTWLELYLSP